MREEDIFAAGTAFDELPRNDTGELALAQLQEQAAVLRRLVHVPSARLPDRRTATSQEPLALIQFEADNYKGKQNITPCAPTICLYVRFQLLSSFNPRRHPREIANFDVSKLQVFGAPIVLRPPSER